MKKNYLFIVMSISVLLLAAAYGVSTADGAADTAVRVTIEGSAFSPEVAVVKIGGEVVWKNKDSSVHTVTANDGSFDSGSLEQNGEFRKKFTSPGTIKYSCDNHAWMSGSIEVR